MKKVYKKEDHTFAICAYKESQYLEECICSVLNQNIRSNILIATATPNEHITMLADKYNIPLYVRKGQGEIAKDWNFALKCAKTELVTVTHQDDIYCENYLQDVLKCINKSKKPLIIFGDYGEIRGTEIITDNKLLRIKKLMLFPLRVKALWTSRFVRRRILSFGSAICCPSVTFVKPNLPNIIFKSGYQSDLDWQAWESISKISGSFVYCNKVIMMHRIHEESATTKIIASSNRTKEDFDMYCKFWPRWISESLVRFYAKSQDSNRI